MLINNDRLSHWFAGAVVSWLAFLFLGILVLHFGLNVSIATLATFVGACCVMQLAVTPWLYRARATSTNSRGRPVERAAALCVLFGAIILLFFGYLRSSYPSDIETRHFTTIGFIGTVPAMFLIFIVVAWPHRNHKERSTSE